MATPEPEPPLAFTWQGIQADLRWHLESMAGPDLAAWQNRPPEPGEFIALLDLHATLTAAKVVQTLEARRGNTH